jgi:hypothetical protein
MSASNYVSMFAFPMRLHALVFAATLATAGVSAQEPSSVPATSREAAPPHSEVPAPSSAEDAQQETTKLNLPVSLDHIRKALDQQPGRLVLRLPDQPTFRIQVQERNRLQDLLSTLDFRGGPTPAGGLYAAEIQRVMFPSVSNPLTQPYAAFNQPELLTVLIENLMGKYLIGKAFNSINSIERERAEAAARDEVRQTIARYCAGQPGGGAGIQICSTPVP